MTEAEKSETSLPDHWHSVRLGKVTKEVSRVNPGDHPGKKITYIDISSVDNDRYAIAEPSEHLGDEAPSRARQLIKEGDILFSTVRTYLRNIALVPQKHDGDIASTGFCVVRPSDALDSQFFFYYSLTPDFVEPLNKRQRGTSYPAVRDDDVFEQVIPLPPLPEQRRIVAKIEELFSNLDAGMGDLQAAEQQLERYRLSVLQSAVEGRLTADWRETHDPEPADQLLEKIGEERRAEWEERYRWNRYESKGKEPPSGWKSRYKTPEQPESNARELPSTWFWATVQQVSFVGTGATPKRGNPEFWDGGDIPWVTSGALNAQYVEEAEECITEEALEETSCEIFPKHSLLIAMYGEGKTRGKVAELMIEAATNQACAAVEVVGNKPALREYLKVYFQKNYHDIRRQAAGGVQPNLNLGIIRGINIPLPPLAEQKRIVDEVERLLSVADDASDTADREHTRADRLRQSILKQAFSGQLVPHDDEANPPTVDTMASETTGTPSSNDRDSDAEDLLGSTDPDKQIEMDI